eukprot:4428316-Pleurochrysis_carterae.AAC.1
MFLSVRNPTVTIDQLGEATREFQYSQFRVEGSALRQVPFSLGAQNGFSSFVNFRENWPEPGIGHHGGGLDK